MDVFLVKYETGIDTDEMDGMDDGMDEGLNSLSSTEIIGIFGSFNKAKDIFQFYIAEIEKAWREQDGTIDANNTFNLFSEPVEDILMNAVCQRQDGSNRDMATDHTVSVIKYTVE